jgi:Uma2 family endonuclease
MIRKVSPDSGARGAVGEKQRPLRAVMPVALPEVLAWRKKTGADRWDEMWDGVLHMAPAPNRYHQDLEGGLEAFLRQHWAPRTRGKVYHQINVARPGRWPNDFRIPDVVLLSPERFHIDRNEYFEGGPDVAVEIHSPGDEAYDRLDFYFSVGVHEVWIIRRETLQVEIYLPRKRAPKAVEPDADGWISSRATGVRFRTKAKKPYVRLGDHETTLP